MTVEYRFRPSPKTGLPALGASLLSPALFRLHLTPQPRNSWISRRSTSLQASRASPRTWTRAFRTPGVLNSGIREGSGSTPIRESLLSTTEPARSSRSKTSRTPARRYRFGCIFLLFRIPSPMPCHPTYTGMVFNPLHGHPDSPFLGGRVYLCQRRRNRLGLASPPQRR